VVVIAAGAALVWRRHPAPAVSRPALNVLLVTLDTTRADHIGVYGSTRARTRYLDGLAREGVLFTRAYAQAPITLPSHASIFTALLPPAHGARNNGNFYVPERLPTLATALKAAGYRTGAFVSSFILDRRYGLARGFDVYDDEMQGERVEVLALEAERRGDRTALALGTWLGQQASASPGTPWFAWLHLYDPHEPYSPPQPFRDLFADSPYDGEIAFDDAILASVLDTLGRLGQRDRTLIAVVGDHGESLGEHGEQTHSMFVYECDLRVPLVLWRPGLLPAGRVVSTPVRSIDLAPTLLELAGAPALPGAQGLSLVPLWAGGSVAPRPVYAETYMPQLYMNWAPLRTLADARYKLIDAPRPELYDLERDPAELVNLYEARRPLADTLRRQLELVSGGEGAMNVGALDREALEKLAALGYVGAGSHEVGAPSGTGRDPKDVIHVFNRLRDANSAVRARRPQAALPIVDEVLREDPDNAFARLVKGSAYMALGDNARAVTWFERYLERVPRSSYAHLWIAICYLRMGRQEAARLEADAALAIDPHYTDARVLRAGVLAARGQHDTAIAELREAVATDPAKPQIRLDLAGVLREAGRTDEARAEYERLLRSRPDDVAALTGLGVLQAEAGSLADAERTLRRALQSKPGALDARFDLAEVLVRQGRVAEAAAEYRRISESAEAPSHAQERARQALATLPR
jgi:choline-sulfatase